MHADIITVDFHGLVLLDPDRLIDFFGGHIHDGTNVYRAMTTSDVGEEVIRRGIVLPILGINDSHYEVFVRSPDEASRVDDAVIFENGVYPLQVGKRLVIADMAVLVEWEAESGWRNLPVHAGTYAVTIRGFRYVTDGRVARFGYEFILAESQVLPGFTADMQKSMQVLELPGSGSCRHSG